MDAALAPLGLATAGGLDAVWAPLALSTAGDVAQKAGVVLAVLLAGAALVAPGARVRALAMLGALLLAPALLVGYLWSGEQLAPLRERPALLAALAVGGLLALGAGAFGLLRRPAAFPLLAAAALPFRIPVESGGTTASLLLPLYLVVGAGALAHAVPRLRRDAEEPRPGRLEWALGVALALYGIQAAASSDFDRALEQVVFFYVPFAVLFALLVRVAWSTRLAAAVLGVLVALAAVFVGIGFYEYGTRQLLLNPDVINANEFASYFRVNSLFFDPNIYGRFLVVVMLGVTAVLLWTRRPRVAVAGAAGLALLWAGLVVTFSQTSFAALLAGLAVLGGLRWGARRAAAVAAAVIVVAATVVVMGAGSLRLDLGSQDSVRDATSGRYDLVAGGVELFAARPVLGWGPGAFRRQYRRQENASAERATNASHTIPVTVAAEQGVVGLLAYLAVLAIALALLLRRAGGMVARAAVAAGFVALVVHTLLYAAFLEDPLSWALLGAGAALARR